MMVRTLGWSDAEGGGEFEAGHLGHLDVGDEDVGSETADGVECVATVGAGGDDGDVGFEVEESGESAEHHGLIFGEGYADGGRWESYGESDGHAGCFGSGGSGLRELDEEGHAWVGGDGEAAAEGLDALAHAAEAVALLKIWRGAVVGDEEGLEAVGRCGEAHAAVGGMGVADDVGDGFADGEAEDGLFGGVELWAVGIRRRG